nr:immunoglobulin heavy chain junction region [Mus musculus]
CALYVSSSHWYFDVW